MLRKTIFSQIFSATGRKNFLHKASVVFDDTREDNLKEKLALERKEKVEKLAKRLKLKILTFPHILCNVVRKCDLFFGDIHDYTSGPREFIGLIQNAELIVTDSFHASVFSMIFETPFYVFKRDKADAKNSTNRRIYDFLKEYQLVSEESLAEVNKIPEVDFKYAHQHWEKRREESLEYLEHALGVKRRKHR